MIKTRIKKLEKIIPTDNDPLDDLSNTELDELAFKLRVSLHKTMKNKKEAREYKELFIDSPTHFEMCTQTTKTRPEMLALLEKQRDWEIEHLSPTQEIKEENEESYESIIKSYKFLRP
jgi:hypothetical protein